MAPQTRRASRQKPSTRGTFLTLKVRKTSTTNSAVNTSAPSQSRGVKRRRSSAKGGDDEEYSGKKTRSWSNQSNPAIGPRAQIRRLQDFLSNEDGSQHTDTLFTAATRNVTQVEEITFEMVTEKEVADSAEVPSQDMSATPVEVTDLAIKTETPATHTEISVGQDAQVENASTRATPEQSSKLSESPESNASNSPDQVDDVSSIADNDTSAAQLQATKFSVVSARRTSTIAIKTRGSQKKGVKKSRTNGVKSMQKNVQQTNLLAHVQEMQPHAPSEGKKFKIVKLRYSRSGGSGRMSMALFKKLPIFDKYIDKNGNLKVAEKSKFWDTLTLKIKFDFSPFLNFPEPRPHKCYEALRRMEDHLESIGITSAHGPAYGAKAFNIGSFLKTILAQGTDNKLAIQAERICANYFPFVVDGKPVVGETPNYHAMAVASVEEIAASIQRCGTNMRKALTFKVAMEAVTAMNVHLLKEANGGILPFDTELGQPANTSKFVPGLLSCDFLFEKDKAQLFNWFLSLSGIGHKSTSCFLEFNFGFPICAVDTHVVTMVKFLGWALRHWDELTTFRHLEGRIPNEIKHRLHQAFWHHRQRCERCKQGLARNDPGRPGTPPCPIEDLVVRFKDKKRGRTEGDDADEDKPKRQLTAKKVNLPGHLGKKPSNPTRSTVIAWGHFANAELAAKEGYVILEYSMDDDFAAGSANVSLHREWWFKGFATQS